MTETSSPAATLSSRHALARLAARWLPIGDTLPESAWRGRHRLIVNLLWAHVVAFSAYAVITSGQGEGVVHGSAEAALVAALAVGARWPGFGKRTQSALSTVGLFTCSAILTHLTGGLIESHFHFFVMVVVVSLYHAWVPFLLGLGVVVLHHGVGGALLGSVVFEHGPGAAAPWTWALVHGAFILAQSAACLVAWRGNEDALIAERDGRLLLEKAHGDLAAAQQLSRVGSWEADFRSGIVQWSDEMYRITGLDPVTDGPSWEALQEHVHPDDRARLSAEIERVLAEHGAMDVEHRMVRADGTELVVHARGRSVVVDGQIVQMLGTCQDITAQRRLESEMEHRAFHDPLTGLANRALLVDRITHALAVRHRSDSPVTLLYLDLDDFKTVNDSLGHTAGDELLVAIAARLRTTVRPGDTVARLGGDEFAILLEDTDVDGAERAAERVLESLALPVPMSDRSVAARASIGIAGARPGVDAADLLRHADIAMYAAKKRGKSGFAVFTPDMLSSVLSRMETLAELRHAVEREQFTLHYQPIIELGTGTVRGVEALVRWEHPERGTIPPLEFIPLAEETGLMVTLGEWITRTAVRDVKAMQEATGEPITLSVNVSPRQFDSDVAAMVVAALEDGGLRPEHLVVEITESSMISREDRVLAQLVELRAAGVRVAIDDFGTGYSSLGYLRDLPVDVLKIDRGFIQRMAEGDDQAALARAIITLSDAFDLETVAEGIETSEQADRLTGFGCHSGQGFLFSRPKPAADILRELLDTGALDLRAAV